MKKHILPVSACIAAIFTPAAIPQVSANEALIWVGYYQTSSDFWGDGRSKFQPDGNLLGLSYLFADELDLSYSYSKSEGEQSWQIPEFDRPDLVDVAESKSESHTVSATWLLEDYSLSFSYSDLESEERALIRFPIIGEITVTDDRIISVGYEDFSLNDNWITGWSLGFQYADSKNDNLQVFVGNQTTSIATRFNQKSYSFYADFDISYDLESESMIWTPQFSVGWNFELSSEGEPLVLLTRGDERTFINQFNDRFIRNYRTPDSGFWSASMNFDLKNGWNTSLAYSQTISAPVDISSLSWDLSLSF